jgi:hypothetical protein
MGSDQIEMMVSMQERDDKDKIAPVQPRSCRNWVGLAVKRSISQPDKGKFTLSVVQFHMLHIQMITAGIGGNRKYEPPGFPAAIQMEG